MRRTASCGAGGNCRAAVRHPGWKKTSLDELVQPAGIAKGSFYAFFDSKESLYLDVMLRRAPQVGARLAEALAGPVDEENLVGLMRAITDVLVDDPFYRGC